MTRSVLFFAFVLALVGCHGTSISSSQHPGVVAMRKDANLESAVKEAQSSLPTFLERLKHAKPRERFAAQVRFRSHMTFEHMWVDHLTYDGKLLRGTLADEPVSIKVLHKGVSVNFAPSQVMDWLILSDGKREGGFAEAVLKQERG